MTKKRRAHRSLEAARRDVDADDYWRAISPAYYAMFHAASAALNEAGEEAKSHPGTHHLLYQIYVQTGRLDAAYTSMLTRIWEKRLKADTRRGPSSIRPTPGRPSAGPGAL